jgi:hypothetical protein
MIMRAPRVSLLAFVAASFVAACARGPAPPPRAVAASSGSPTAYPFATTAPAEEPAAVERPEVTFDREYEDAVPTDAESSVCSFNSNIGVDRRFGYDGMVYVHGRPFARIDALGEVKGTFVNLEEGSLYARSTFSADHATLTGDIYLPDLPLYASVPIVYDGWIHVLRTRVATKTSVKGPFFAPDVKLPPGVRLRTPLREDAIRIPCAYVSTTPPESDVNAFDDASSTVALDSPDKNVSISLTPAGAPVADIAKPTRMNVGLITMYKTTALVSVKASTKESEVLLVGWIHEGELNEDYGGVGLGTVGTIGHAVGTPHFDCDGVSIFVETDHKLFKVADIESSMGFWGAIKPNGDLRVDLGADPDWSWKTPAKAGPKAPLDPFVPKEYLARCKRTAN